MLHIISVVAKENYKVEVSLNNGCIIVVNMEHKLNTIRFGPLTDHDIFINVTTDGNYVKWKVGIEVSVAELFQLAQR